ncbi:hypothetical protein QF042_003778 [Pedobacter sp. W3I1]|nr:hypothetical protein [Pedobacter sp. W3I1]
MRIPIVNVQIYRLYHNSDGIEAGGLAPFTLIFFPASGYNLHYLEPVSQDLGQKNLIFQLPKAFKLKEFRFEFFRWQFFLQ